MRGLRLVTGALAAALAAAWAARRQGLVTFEPRALALGAGLLLLLLALLTLAQVARAARSGGARARALCAAGISAGLALAVAGGLANWLLSLQGYVVLSEGEAVPLGATRHLQELEAGPLARTAELDVTLQLEQLELRPAGEGRFTPLSRLRVLAAGAPAARLELTPRASAAWRSLRFHQGAFGFAPRLVIQRDGRVVFDRTVPFTTTARAPGALAFEGRFTVAAEQLELAGQLDLSELDFEMRGHARLGLELRHGGRVVGRGVLSPGHFAEAAEGYRVGFAGLTRWTEIDVSRRHYGGVVRAGALLALVATLGWAAAAWSRR